MSSDIIGFLEKRRLSILERLPSSQRMSAREETGKPSKKTIKKLKRLQSKHLRKDWDAALWD